jgi:hypothetical protein
MRSKKRPPERRARAKAVYAEKAWPLWSWPVGLGAKRVVMAEAMQGAVSAGGGVKGKK